MKATPLTLVRRKPTGQYTETANQASVLSEIYRVWVPRGVVWKLDPTRPALITLATAEDQAAGGSHAAIATDYDIARVLNPAAGYTDGKNQLVALKSDGTERTITAVADHVDAPGSPTITCSDETDAAHRYCYIPWANGRVVIKVEAPRGQGALAYPIFDGNTKQFHALNQSRFQRLESPFPIPPDFAIVVYLDAAWIVAFASGASAGAVNLDFNRIQLPILQSPERDFFEPGEPRPGYNFRQRVEEMMMHSVR